MLIKLKPIKINNTTTSLETYGTNLSCTIGYKLDSNISGGSAPSCSATKNIIINEKSKEVLVGSLLGDGNIRKTSLNGNCSYQITQSINKIGYILHQSKLLSHYCTQLPSIRRVKKGHDYIQLYTRSLVCMNNIYNMFYKKGKKVVPTNIEEYITPLSLATWAQEDGIVFI